MTIQPRIGETQTLPEIAFIGLGAMGMPMAKNLCQRGYRLRGYDIRDTARAEIAAAGGQTAAKVRNAFVGADIAVLMVVNAAQAEEIVFAADALGLDMAEMLDIVSGSAASSWMVRDRGPRMLQADPPVTSAVDIFVKDLGIVLEAGRDAKAALPFAALAHQLFLSVSGRGFGAFDDSQVIKAYRAMQGRTDT